MRSASHDCQVLLRSLPTTAESAQPRIPTLVTDPLSRGAREGSGNETIYRDGAGLISRERDNAAALLARDNKLSLKNTPLGSKDPPIPQAMPFRLIDIFVFPLKQFFLTRDFPIFSSSSSFFFFIFFFFFFLSHRPSALRKR